MARPAVHIERLTLQDATSVAADRAGAAANVGVLLVLGGCADLDDDVLIGEIGARLVSVPRLRQVLRRAPLGGGRPYWTDAARVVAPQHLSTVSAEAGDAALLDLAASLVARRLPLSRPLWRAVLIAQSDGRRAVVVAMHHVVTDGIGGLAMLAALDDRVWEPAPLPPAAHPPSDAQLRADARRRRHDAVRGLPTLVRTFGEGLRELSVGRRPRALDRSALNRPTGGDRGSAWVSADLAGLLARARTLDATLTDLVVAVVAGALAEAMVRRGENPTRLVANVPVSGRVDGDDSPGNVVGVIPVEVPVREGVAERIRSVARSTARHRSDLRGASGALLGAVFGLVAAAGLSRAVLDHQRLVSTFVSSVRGPAEPMRLAGHGVEQAIAFAVTPGNIGVSFLALSYAGTLGVSVVADPAVVPEYREIAARIGADLADLASRTDALL